MTPLLLAATRSKAPVIEVLLSKGANLGAVNLYGKTVIECGYSNNDAALAIGRHMKKQATKRQKAKSRKPGVSA